MYHSCTRKTSVEVNRNQLLQILVNLPDERNSRDGRTGTLTISSEDCRKMASHGAIVHVHDEGCGIKEEQRIVFFSPFSIPPNEMVQV